MAHIAPIIHDTGNTGSSHATIIRNTESHHDITIRNIEVIRLDIIEAIIRLVTGIIVLDLEATRLVIALLLLPQLEAQVELHVQGRNTKQGF